MNNPYTQSKTILKVVTLVPFTSNEPSRIAAWEAVQSWWFKKTRLPIVVGESNLPAFNISLARNRAAKKAGQWDVAVILDADTLITATQVSRGINLTLSTGAVVYPYTERWEVDHVGTQMFLANPDSTWHQHAKRHANEHFGGCVIVTRKLWDEVRGYDPGFIAWGHEDGAFLAACTTIGGLPFKRITGKVFHLEHEPSPVKNPKHPQYLANRKRIMRYMQATKQPNAAGLIRKLRDETIDIV